MKSKSSLQLFIILLVFSFVLSSAALQTPRRLLPNTEKLSTTQTTSDHKGAKKFWNGEEMFDMVEGRVDLESDDYPGTGANNRHDPKTPGTP